MRGHDAANEDAQVAGGRDDRLWTPTFILIVGATLFCYMVGQGSNAGTSVYLAQVGGTATLAGIGAGVFSAAAGVARFFCGPTIDRRGRLIVVKAGIFVAMAGTVGPMFANDGAAFILWRALQGMGFSLSTTAAATAAADVLPGARLGEGIGYFGLAQALSMSLGPAISLFLVSTEPATNFYVGLTLFLVVGAVCAFICRYEKNPSVLPASSSYRRRWEERQASGAAESGQEQKAKRKLTLSDIFEKRALPGAIPMLVISPAFGFSIFFMGMYGTSLDVSNPGLYYIMASATMILVRLKSKTFMGKMSSLTTLAIAVAMGLIAYGMMIACGLTGSKTACELLFYAAGLPYGVSMGLAVPVNQTVAVSNSPAEHWGAANALFQLTVDIGCGATSIGCGILNDTLGFTFTLCLILVFTVASLGAARLCYPEKDRRWR